jgi:hemolysin activation/secretion protein
VLAAPQDLQGGDLHLKLVIGRIRVIRFAEIRCLFARLYAS